MSTGTKWIPALPDKRRLMNCRSLSGRSTRTVLLLLAGLGGLTSCGPDEAPQGRRISFPDATASQGSSGGLTFTAPAGWIEEAPEGQSRRAQFRLPGSDSGDAELVVFVFPGGGGSTQANIDRWIGQFSNPDGSPASGQDAVTTREVNGLNTTVVDVSGTYRATMRPGAPATGPLTDRRLLGAVIETGGDPWFVRLLGPSSTVARWEKSFEQYIDSATSQ